MSGKPGMSVALLMRYGAQLLPFADAATPDLPLARLLRLSLFQVSIGMTMVLLSGTLNRVMIVELDVSAGLVAAMLALPVVLAPARALIGYKSDTHRSYLGWRRVPYIWFGSLMQFGGLAIMPFALLLLSPEADAPKFVGVLGAALAFLLAGAGVHTTQTAGLALATDLAKPESQPRVVALLYVMQLVGMTVSAVVIGQVLADFTAVRLIQVVQGAAVIAFALNMVAMWKQEARSTSRTAHNLERPKFATAWRELRQSGQVLRLLTGVACGAAAFGMQDILLEPYGAEVLGMGVGATTTLTALMAGGSLAAFGLAAYLLARRYDIYRIAAYGALAGIAGFAVIVFAGPMRSAEVFRAGIVCIGFGGGLFSVATLTAAMTIAKSNANTGMALGAWGAVQATATGLAMAAGGIARDIVAPLSESGALGAALHDRSAPYLIVYHVEIALLFAALVAIGPLVRRVDSRLPADGKLGLAELPG